MAKISSKEQLFIDKIDKQISLKFSKKFQNQLYKNIIATIEEYSSKSRNRIGISPEHQVNYDKYLELNKTKPLDYLGNYKRSFIKEPIAEPKKISGRWHSKASVTVNTAEYSKDGFNYANVIEYGKNKSSGYARFAVMQISLGKLEEEEK